MRVAQHGHRSEILAIELQALIDLEFEVELTEFSPSLIESQSRAFGGFAGS